MPTSESLVASDRLRQPTPIDGDSVISLAISPFQEDLSFLQAMFADANWKLLTAHTYQEGVAQLSRVLIPVVLCECRLADGDWKDVLSRLAPMLEPPRVIVVSHHADERLWSEVLSLGGFDLLATPFREVEVGYAIGTAWLDWEIHARSAGKRLDGHDLLVIPRFPRPLALLMVRFGRLNADCNCFRRSARECSPPSAARRSIGRNID
jgi:hypothetical protein